MPSTATAPVPAATSSMLNLDKLRATPLNTDPFDYLVVPGFLSVEVCADVERDYPTITSPGSFPLHALQYSGAFRALLDEIEQEPFRKVVEEKFSLDLSGRPTMITVRGMCSKKDGKIHTDTESKIITVLLYMNGSWQEQGGGQLRLLRSENLEDVVTELPPTAGTLLLFRRANNSFHGHKSYSGPRKVIQMNWVTEQKFANRNILRHRISSLFKRLNPWGGEY